MKIPAPSYLSTFIALFLMTSFAVAQDPAASPGPSSIPSALPSDLPMAMMDPNSRHAAAEACQVLVKEWAMARNVAHHELAACNLHRFNEACLNLSELRQRVVAPKSPCLKIREIKDFKLPEINCNVVQVPPGCADK